MRLLAETEALRELPIPPLGFALIAIVVFAALLAVTFAFRGATNRHNPAAFHAQPQRPSVGEDDPHLKLGSGH